MKALFIIILLIIPYSLAYAGDVKWDKKEKALYGAFIAGQIINYAQANYVLAHPDWYEINPVLDFVYNQGGELGLLAWKAGSSALVGLITDRVSHKWRKRILVGVNTVVWGLIGHDLYFGVGFRF